MAQETEENEPKQPPTENTLQPPVVPPPRKVSKPRITLKIPPLSPQLPPFFTTPGVVTLPMTPAQGFSPVYPANFFQAYPNKAQEFMFKRFEGFKDFTKSTGKIGLSFGEKTAFWMYGKVRRLSRNGFTHIFLFFVVMLYCLLGGFLFYVLEKPYEMEYLDKAKTDVSLTVSKTKVAIRSILNQKLYLNEDVNVLGQKTDKVVDELVSYFKTNSDYLSSDEKWEMISSIYFCGTVFTTIGYGHMAPKTTLGRIATIVYSLFGIPMFLILLADYGKLFTRGIKFLWAFVRRLYYTGSCRKVRRTVPVQEMMKGMQLMYDMTKRGSTNKDEMIEVARAPQTARISPTETPAMSAYIIDDEFNLPISVAFSILVTYMIGGAMFFHYTEGWDYIVSFYYVYISISTIGFGDFVPKSQVILMLISLVYFVFGLSLTSMCINVIQEKLSDSFKQASAKLGATIGFQVDEEGNAVPVALADDEQPDAIVTEEEENKVEGNQDP